MLTQLRKGASGWVAQLLIAILVLSFAVWGVAGIFTGFLPTPSPRVGSTDITIPQFQRHYDVALTRSSGSSSASRSPRSRPACSASPSRCSAS